MLLRPNVLRLDQVHLTLGHQIIDRAKIANVFVLHELTLDRSFTFLDVSRYVIYVRNTISESNPGSVQIHDSSLGLRSIRRQEGFDGFVQMNGRRWKTSRHSKAALERYTGLGEGEEEEESLSLSLFFHDQDSPKRS